MDNEHVNGTGNGRFVITSGWWLGGWVVEKIAMAFFLSHLAFFLFAWLDFGVRR
jgi:hypothetical protein